MTTIPASAIRLAYLWQCNVAMAAFTLSQTWKVKITADELDLRFDSECVNHPLLHELGTRPETGFVRSAKVEFARRMIEQEHASGGVAA